MCNGKRDRLRVRFPFLEIECLLFEFLRSCIESTSDIESTYRKYLNIKFPGSLCLPHMGDTVLNYKKNQLFAFSSCVKTTRDVKLLWESESPKK